MRLDVEVNQRQAFKDTVILAELCEMPDLPGSSLGLEHLKEMAQTIEANPDFSDAKLGRWLGWAQAALVASGVGVDLEDVKRLNASLTDDD